MAWRMKGEYFKNCSCMASCTCDADGRPSPNSFCEGAFGMLVTEGDYEGVKIDGTKWVATVHFPKAMFEGNGDLELYIDKSASEEQRTSLLNILSGKNGGPIMQIIAAVAPNFHGPHFADIDWEFDHKKRTARVKVGSAFETTTAPIAWPPDNIENHVIVKMPNGFEYKECEVAHAKVLRSTGHNKFDWVNTHSSLALVNHTNEALLA